jgi:hypothetical protein
MEMYGITRDEMVPYSNNWVLKLQMYVKMTVPVRCGKVTNTPSSKPPEQYVEALHGRGEYTHWSDWSA